MKKSDYIKCDCGSELICIEGWPSETGEKAIYISLWEQGNHNNNALTIFDRLRWCWQILKTGRPFTDEIILYKDGIEQLYQVVKEHRDGQ